RRVANRQHHARQGGSDLGLSVPPHGTWGGPAARGKRRWAFLRARGEPARNLTPPRTHPRLPVWPWGPTGGDWASRRRGIASWGSFCAPGASPIGNIARGAEDCRLRWAYPLT